MTEDKSIIPSPTDPDKNFLEFFFDGRQFRAHKTQSGQDVFVGADLCAVLGLNNTSQALKAVPEEEKGLYPIYTPGGIQDMLCVNEAGLFRLIFRSDKPDAERLRTWVFATVLPALRKTGTYSLRSTERRSYKDVRDCFAQASDYDPKNPACQFFFANVQNKIHFAVTGQTAAEIISERANHQQPKMGLVQLDKNNVHKADVIIAKNYLSDDELSLEDSLDKSLYILVNVLAKQIDGGRPATTAEFVECVDMHILSFRMDLLTSRGQISMKQAKKIAEQEYTRFKKLIKGGQ